MKSKQADHQFSLPKQLAHANPEPEVLQQQYQTTIQILQQVQNDYSRARNQLETICHNFSEKEAATKGQLHSLLATATEPPLTSERGDSIAGGEPGTRQSLVSPSLVSLRVYCFGSFEIHLNWRKLDRWHSLKAKSLLKFLISRQGRPTPKDVLIETLWPNCDPEVGGNNLKSAVYALRQILTGSEPKGDNKAYSPLVLFSEGGYLIAPKLELWVDVDEFEQRWLTGRRLEKEEKKEEATRQYRLAEELYRGDYLEDELYTEWTLLRREALKDTYLAILGKLANATFKAVDYESCILYCQKILAKDSCHEEAYQWLIRCYSRLGQRHRAHQWYELCVATIRKELDSAPDRKTITLYHRLLRQEPI